MNREPPDRLSAEGALRPQAPSGLLKTLLSFEEAPGRYAVVLREPRMLFDHQLAVMQLAAGRDLPEYAEQPRAVLVPARRAARFFVRSVMLKPGSDHYSLLGLTPGFEPSQLREHYRLMIRLTHPDFASPDEAWPTDSAARINIANDVLGSPVKRREYNEQMAAAQAVVATPAGAGPSPSVVAGARPKPSVVPRRMVSTTAGPSGWSHAWSPRAKIGLVGGGALLVAGLFIWLNGPVEDKGSLRARTPVAAPAPLVGTAAVSPEQPTVASTATSADVETVSAPPALTVHQPVSNRSGSASLNEERSAPSDPAASARSVAVAGRSTGAHVEVPASRAPKSVDSRPQGPADAVDPETPHLRLSMAVAKGNPSPAVAPDLAGEPVRAVADWVYPPTAAASPVASRSEPSSVPASAQAPPAEPAMPTRVVASQTSPVVALAPVAAAPAAAQLVLDDVRPTLAKVVQNLSEQQLNAALLNIPRPLQDATANRAFAREFYQYLAGQRVTQLERVSFRAEPGAEELVVHGVMSMWLEDSAGNRGTKDLHIQAVFQRDKGRPVLARLVARSPS